MRRHGSGLPRGARRALAFAFLLVAAACGSDTGSLVISGATIWDGTGGPAIPDATFVIEDGRVACVGTAAACPDPEGADRVDAAGFWIIPGLIDTHTHATRDPVAAARDERLRFLLGVTAARATGPVGANPDSVLAASLGGGAATRLLAAGRIDASADRSDAGDAVRALAAAGAPSVELEGSPAGGPLDAVIAAAAAADLGVWGAPTAVGLSPDGPGALSPAIVGIGGVGELASARRPWLGADPGDRSRLARELASRSVWLEPRLAAEERRLTPYGIPVGLHRLGELPYVLDAIREDPDAARPDDAERDSLVRALDAMRAFVRDFRNAGGTVVAGTAGEGAPGLTFQEELKALVRAGLSPEEALAAGTRDAARVLGASDSLGTLVSGKLADFVVLEGDPTADIRHLELVSRVARGGVLHDPASMFDELTEDLRDRTTGSGIRLLAGLLSVVLVVGGTAVAVWRHGRRHQAG